MPRLIETRHAPSLSRAEEGKTSCRFSLVETGADRSREKDAGNCCLFARLARGVSRHVTSL
jgi:hypothetical protein